MVDERVKSSGQGFSLKCVEFGMKKTEEAQRVFLLKILDFCSLKVHTRHESRR